MRDAGQLLPCRHLRVPRQGHNLDECQDAAASDPEKGRFAVADGASESPHAALWARLLVDAFVRNGEVRIPWADWLPAIQQRWASVVSPQANAAPLPWFLEPGVQQGAFATFLGLILRTSEDDKVTRWQGDKMTESPSSCHPVTLSSCHLHWEALALGDSCLFQIRDDQLVRAFPVSRSTDFTSTPWLVGSRSEPRQRGEVCQGEALPRDQFWLMTDALAQWFLIQVEHGGKPWQIVECLLHRPDASVFAEWVEQLRRSRQLRNDDVTLLGVSVE